MEHQRPASIPPLLSGEARPSPPGAALLHTTLAGESGQTRESHLWAHQLVLAASRGAGSPLRARGPQGRLPLTVHGGQGRLTVLRGRRQVPCPSAARSFTCVPSLPLVSRGGDGGPEGRREGDQPSWHTSQVPRTTPSLPLASLRGPSSHVTEGKTEAQRGQGACSGSRHKALWW